MKCPSCGADMAPDEVQCSHCSSFLPATANSQRAATFARIKASAAYENRSSPQRLARLPNVAGMQKVFLHIFFIFFISSSGIMAVLMLGMAAGVGLFGFQFNGGMGAAFSLAPLVMAIVPIGFVVLGVFLFRRLRKKMDSLENDPVEAFAVIIIDKRMQVSGGSGDSSAHTAYFITCEADDGERQEYQVWDGRLYGRLTDGDAGIVFVRAGYGLDFERVAV